jgi:hypothetical protein
MGLGDALDQAVGAERETNGHAQPPPQLEPPEQAFPDNGGGYGHQQADDSIVAFVRQRAAQLHLENTIDIPIPGYDGRLVGRYKAVSLSRVYSGGKTDGTLRNPMAEWGIAADALARALITLCQDRQDGSALEPLSVGDAPARYDLDFAHRFGLEPAKPTAREVMRELFGGGEQGESRIWSHYLDFQNWLMEGGAQEVAEEAVGEP